MIYRLEIENFYSIRDPQVLDLRIAKNMAEAPERFAPIFPGSEERVPKVVALLGPNGSGKSTVLKALAFIGWFVRDSFQYRGAALPCERFNDEASVNRPIRLAIEMGGPLDLAGSDPSPLSPDEPPADELGTYRYELHLRPDNGVVRSVSHESLRMRRNGQGKWRRVFERNTDRSVSGSNSFPLTGFSQVVDKIREDASVIATLALFEHRAAKLLSAAAGRMFMNILIDRTDLGDQAAIQYLAQHPDVLEALNRELQRIDVGVEEMQIVPSGSGPIALFKHQGLQANMHWSLESHGTRSFIRIFPLILLALRNGGIALIDELDQSIHPLILPEIVRWFYDPKRNEGNAQLWMSGHSASLLDDLCKEEVVFCEKDHGGRSRFYSLMDVAAVRRSDNLYKKYLSGVYGAVPQVG